VCHRLRDIPLSPCISTSVPPSPPPHYRDNTAKKHIIVLMLAVSKLRRTRMLSTASSGPYYHMTAHYSTVETAAELVIIEAMTCRQEGLDPVASRYVGCKECAYVTAHLVRVTLQACEKAIST
jgi:hypothetical protein